MLLFMMMQMLLLAIVMAADSRPQRSDYNETEVREKEPGRSTLCMRSGDDDHEVGDEGKRRV